ncbi:MAG: peptidoglycan editing factor PgeF [Cyanobacteriota bacterium]
MAEVAADPEGPFGRPDSAFNTLPGWTWIGCYGGYYLQCDRLAAFEHGFFTRLWQGRPPEVLAGYLSAGITVHRTRQVHGAVVLPASAAGNEPWPEADGLVSDRGGQSLWVCGADCTPVLIADPVSGRVASCHAGWRGVAGGILQKTVAALQPDPDRRHDLLVALGPAVSGPKYQVTTSVALRVISSLTAEERTSDGDLQRWKRDGVLLDDPEADHSRLDIRLAAARQLQTAGVRASNIQICPLCTVSEPELFHSWRRDQVKAVQWSGIVSQTPEFAKSEDNQA